MTQKLGIIQARGAGDIIMALPIAKYYYNRGVEVHWVVDKAYYEAFSYAAPYVTFYPISAEESTLTGNIRNPYWYEEPKAILEKAGVDSVLNFPFEECKHQDKIRMENRLVDAPTIRARKLKLANFNTFDRFKYAVANVPFLEKWNLDLRRNPDKELELFNKVVDPNKRLIVANLSGAMGKVNLSIDMELFRKNIGMEDAQIVHTSNITDNPLDWFGVLEAADCFVGIDSFFVNLIDQMKIDIEKKFFVRRSNIDFTPTLGTQWDYLAIDLPIDNPHELNF